MKKRFAEMTPGEQQDELEKCKKGRKVQILIILEHNDRLTSGQLETMANIKNANLRTYTNRLEDNGLIEMYDESRFKPADEANFKYTYHSLTNKGRSLISDLHMVSRRQE